MSCISVEELSKSFNGTVVLRNVSFSIDCGEAVTLLGPNGAGKTTTLRILAGLMRPDHGLVRICGIDMFRNPALAKACVGYLPEDAVPFLNLTVRENLEYVAALRGIRDIMGAVDDVMQLLDLEEIADKTAATLSRGNRQRLALAMAIINKPRVLLLDEPLNYLDIPTQEKVIALLRELNSRGTAILVSTHIMSIAERLASRVLIINKGSIVWSGHMNDLRKLANPNERVEEVVARIMTGRP
ncbi:ABC transporter ATP-binding protein [Vulcanisaeta thermophila]|uniref:ABC transporter ATP-binding protein n=1 Tax=Vulcanisaeta thermophila TaxID=867917 RepID=UPI0008529597|nr:ABC transporter ATP-binding protein [Vulcanisaeta thermophila]